MKKTLLATLALATLGLSANAADYTIDHSHSAINLKVGHANAGFVTGRFDTFKGDFSYDKENLADAKVNVTIDTASVNTNHEARDNHIRSADFFDTEKSSEASFTSTEVTKNEDGTLNITGDFTFNGVTKPLTIKTTYLNEATDSFGNDRIGFHGTAAVTFEDFGMTKMMPKNVAHLDIYVEGIKNK